MGTDVWWHLDFTMWSYTFALLVFAFPLAIAPAIAFYNFFLMSTMMLVGPMGVVFLFSLIVRHYQYPLPVRCSSDPVGTIMKPAAFYCLEDVPAVDFKLGREFRRCVHGRYEASPPFQRLMTELTVYWVFMSAVYCGITAAVTWAASLNFAFGWVLGQLFIWALVSAYGCYLLARRGLRKEEAWWAQQGVTLVKGNIQTFEERKESGSTLVEQDSSQERVDKEKLASSRRDETNESNEKKAAEATASA
ncbi:hypothetical protein VKT23_004382 [Stygiomarasmius scandens]|uniref:Uncharacterized protein n=1 Tax=Marasmiellus scandens TaxID=2682957 RepID=A0ABR1JUR9_9AGAR